MARDQWQGINGLLTAQARLRRERRVGDEEARGGGARRRRGVLQCQCAAPEPGGDAWERAHLRADHLAQLHTFAP